MPNFTCKYIRKFPIEKTGTVQAYFEKQNQISSVSSDARLLLGHTTAAAAADDDDDDDNDDGDAGCNCKAGYYKTLAATHSGDMMQTERQIPDS